MPLVRKGPPTPTDRPAADAGLLTTGTPDQRWAAARGLGEAPGGAAPLAAALPTEADPRVREAIFSSLSALGGEAAIGAIVACVSSDDASLRTAALDTLRVAPEAVAPFLGGLLSDPDADVRLLACELLRSQPPGEATRMLCALLDAEAETNVCASALEVLAEVGGAEALPALTRCAERFHAEPFVAFAARLTAERIGAKAAGPADG